MLDSLLWLIKVVKNWARVLASRYLKLKIAKIYLRNGIQFDSQIIDRAEISMLVDIWHRQVYTPDFFSLPNQPTIVDVGANKGYFTVLAATKFPSSRVFAIEPVKDLAERIDVNIQLNQLSNVTVIKKGLWSKSGEREFYLSTNSGGHSMRPKPSSYGQVKISTLSFSDLVAEYQLGQIDLFKLDCEGSEYDILLTLPADLLALIRKISMEIHDFDGHHHEQIAEFLTAHNFQVKIANNYLYAWK